MTATFDSSAWIEYFAGSESGKYFKNIIKSSEIIYTPAVCLFEIKHKFIKEGYEYGQWIDFICSRSNIVDIDKDISLKGADMKIKYGLYSVDALIYAAAQSENSILLTKDHHFKGLDKVKVV